MAVGRTLDIGGVRFTFLRVNIKEGMMLGNSFLIEYDKNAIKRYERMVLSDNSCSGFLPMNFIVREDSIIEIGRAHV